jgi:hypothetical protein
MKMHGPGNIKIIYIIDCKSEVTNIMRKFRCPRKLNVHKFFSLLIFFTKTKTKQNKPAAAAPADTTTVQLESRLYEFC